jgi:hypothetical protein
MKTIKREIEFLGIELEIEFYYYHEQPVNPICPCYPPEYDIIAINHKGEDIYDIVSEIKNFEEKIINKLSENEND